VTKQTINALNTKGHLLDCALTLFAEKGYAATSVRDIIQDAGVTQPTLYYHFADKSDLFTQLVKHHYGESQQKLIDTIASAEGIRDRLMAIAAGSFAFSNQDPRVPRLLFQTYFGPPTPEVAKILDKLTKARFDLVVSVMTLGIDSGELRQNDPRFLALGFCCLIDQPINLFSRKPNPKKYLTLELADATVTLFLNGTV